MSGVDDQIAWLDMSAVNDLIAWLDQQLENQRHRADALKGLACALPAEAAEYVTETAGMLLGDADATRRILREYERLILRDRARVGPYWDGVREAWESALRVRAEAYSGQPGYQERWRLG